MPTTAKPETQPPVSYALEQRLLKAYAAALYAPTTDTERLMQALWGQKRPLTEKQMYGRGGGRGQDTKPGRIGWLDDQAPEVIQLLHTRAQQETLATLLLTDTPDLVGAIRYLLQLSQGGGLHKRETDPRLKDVNEGAACAAEKLLGFGHLSRAAYANKGSFRRMEDAAPVPVPAPKPAVPPIAPPKPKPAPVLVLVELPGRMPATRPRRQQPQPWHGLQLALGL